MWLTIHCILKSSKTEYLVENYFAIVNTNLIVYDKLIQFQGLLMLRLSFSMLVFVLCFSVSAVTYTDNEISNIINSDNGEVSTQNFVRGFFVANDPAKYVDAFIHDKNLTSSILLKEYQLNILLNEVSYQPKQLFLQNFIDKMKQYQSQAFKTHPEGRMEVPVYNIQARALGIENIWSATEALYFYSHSFNKDPIRAISQLRKELSLLTAPQWLGLKNSINDISAENHLKLQDYLLDDVEHLLGLDKFVSHYALLTANKDLVSLGLLHLDKSSGEFLLRNLSDYFAADFVTKQLIQSVAHKKNQVFAISMMQAYLDQQDDIKDSLFQYLKDSHLSSNAAFVLSTTRDKNTIIRLQNSYIDSQSEMEKKQIIFALKMNKLNESTAILNRLTSNKPNDETNKWLRSFKGELK